MGTSGKASGKFESGSKLSDSYHYMADDQKLKEKCPHPIDHDKENEMKPLSSQHREWETALKRLIGAYSIATIKGYQADFRAFEEWCLEQNKVALPSDVKTVCAFIEAQGKIKSPATVRRRIFSIRKVHTLLSLQDPTCDECIKISMRRVFRGKAIRPKQAKGLSRQALKQFCEIQPDSLIGLRNRAMLHLGYELLTRRSELVALRDEDLEGISDGTLRVLIRRSKADPYGIGRIGFTSQETAELVQKWIEKRGPHIDWLFCPVYHNRACNRDLKPATVKNIIKQAAKKSGVSHDVVMDYSGHSLRVGAAQHLLMHGFDTAAIMRAGGWKSTSVLARYLEKAEHNVWSS